MVRFVLRPKKGKRKIIIFTKGGNEGTFSTIGKAKISQKIFIKQRFGFPTKIVKIGKIRKTKGRKK